MTAVAVSKSEALLIAQAQDGSREAMGELVERHYQRMYRVALRIVRNPSDAEDVVQEVSVIVMRKLVNFKGDAALSTWLTTITMNAAVNFLRKRHRQALSLEDIQLEQPHEFQRALAAVNTDPNPEERYGKKETESLVADGLRQLPEHYQQPLRMRLGEDVSVQEIATRLRVPVGTVKVQLFRGRKAMKQHLIQRLRPAA